MPVVEDLYRQYGPTSYVLQAPQHFFLFTLRGMAILAQRAGLAIERAVRDATTTADWYKYSELWTRDVVAQGDRKALQAHFTTAELARFAQIETSLNAQGKGDNVTFVLRHIA